MKTIILCIFIIICYGLFSEIIIPQSMPNCTISVYSDKINIIPDYLFDYQNYIILISTSEFDISQLKKIIHLCGYEISEYIVQIPDTCIIKNAIKNIIQEKGYPISILLLGDESFIPCFYYYNPYTDKTFVGDNYYGIINNYYIEDIPVCRIPIRNNSDLSLLLNKILKYLMYNGNMNHAQLSPFYDANNDNQEDYAYCLVNYNASSSMQNVYYLFQTDYFYPKYFYDGSLIPDFLLYPNYDWQVSYNDINRANDSLCILTYWGHGNQYETVFPNISIAYFDSLHFNIPGGFIGFSCLLGAFDKTLQNNNYCFADSLLFTKNAWCFSLCSSTETFYNYNKLMLMYYYDIIKNLKDPLFICNVFKDIKYKLLNSCTINDYLIAQLNSYNLFSFPLLTVNKQKNEISFQINDTVYMSNPILQIQSNDSVLLYISNNDKIVDTFNVFNTRACTLQNLIGDSYYYISSFENGVLKFDSFYISGNNNRIYNIYVNDIIGDKDNMPEFKEQIYLVYSIQTVKDSIEITLFSDDFIINNPVHYYVKNTLKDSFFITVNCNNKGNLIFKIDNEYYYYTLQTYKRASNFLNYNNINGSLMFVNNEYNLAFKFIRQTHPFDSAVFTFINNEYVEFQYDTISINNIDNDTILIWNNVYFKESEGYITVYADYSFNTDTFTIYYNLTIPYSIYFYDPAYIYENSSFLEFIKDSLNLYIEYSDKPDSNFYYNAYLLSFGYFPNLYNADSNTIDFINNIITRKIPLYIEGSRIVKNCLLENNMIYYFNIQDCTTSVFLADSNYIFFPIINDSIMTNDNIFSADIFITDNGYLLKDKYIFSSYNNTNFIQSIPLKCLYYNDLNFLYYIYILNILNFSSSPVYKDNLFLNKENIFAIKNPSSNPILIKFIYIPHFIKSIVHDSRIILPEESEQFKIILESGLSGNYEDKIIFTDGIDIYTIKVKYINYEIDKNILISNNKIIIPFYADSIIIPHKFNKQFKIKYINGKTIIQGDIYCLSGRSIIVYKNNQKKYFLINTDKISIELFNILGAKINKAITKGIYFTNTNKKIIKLK